MSFRKIQLVGLALGLAALGAGCATVTRGTTEVLTINSTPVGATVSMSNGERCETPCAVQLKRKFPLAVEICKMGYAPVITNILSQISGAGGAGMAGNVLVGGIIGVGVDASSGAMRDLRPNPLSVTLEAADPGCTMPAFPAVPANGQTPADYAKKKKS